MQPDADPILATAIQAASNWAVMYPIPAWGPAQVGLPRRPPVGEAVGRAVLDADTAVRHLGAHGASELRALGSLLLIAPNERTGLTRKHLRRIDAFLTDPLEGDLTR